MDFQKQEEKILAWAKELGLTEERKITTKKPLHHNNPYQNVDFRNIGLYIFFEPDNSENIFRFAVISKDTTQKIAKKHLFHSNTIKDDEPCYKVKFLHNQKIYFGEDVFNRNKNTLWGIEKKDRFDTFYQCSYYAVSCYLPKSNFYNYNQIKLMFEYLNKTFEKANLNPISYENLMNIEQEFIDLQRNKILNELDLVHF